MKTKSMYRVLCVMFLFGLTLSAGAETSSSFWGAKAAAADANPTIEIMLRYAIEDEYLARAEYEAILKKFGSQRPFSNIVKSEETHIGWIKDAYAKLKLQVPADNASLHVVIPASLDEAFRTGVQAEIDNIAMYDHFLETELVLQSANKEYRDLFIRLRDASKNHLEAFKKGA